MDLVPPKSRRHFRSRTTAAPLKMLRNLARTDSAFPQSYDCGPIEAPLLLLRAPSGAFPQSYDCGPIEA